MKKYALVCPGQGSQYVGMAQDFLLDELSKEQLLKANDALGYDIVSIMKDGPIETLTQTQHAQPAIFINSVLLYHKLQQVGINVQAVAGHSLGELTAYYIAGVLSYEDCLKLIQYRASVMAEAYPSDDSAMAAVIGVDVNVIKENLSKFNSNDVVIANYNNPLQTVISGKKDAVHDFSNILKEQKVKIIPLKVSGAFHSPLMQSASEKLADYVADLDFKNATIPIVLNRTGNIETSSNELKQNISEQVISSVHWTDTTNYLTKNVDSIIEIGPGKVLTNLIKKTVKDFEVNSFSMANDIEVYMSNFVEG